MNPASFSQMLNGNKRLMFEDLYAVCDVLGLSVADLMDATVLQNEMQQKVEALLRQANQLTDQADNLKRQAGELLQLGNIHEDSDSRQGALVGASSPRYLVSPYNADGSLRLDNKGVVLGAFSGRNGKKSPEHMEKSETMTTIIMRTSCCETPCWRIARFKFCLIIEDICSARSLRSFSFLISILLRRFRYLNHNTRFAFSKIRSYHKIRFGKQKVIWLLERGVW